eukprot:363127_1
MNHFRHEQMGKPLNRAEMLALIVYTGCDCNYDLCKHQRNGDYEKWKWFDYCLWNAIYKLSRCQKGQYKIYSGLQLVNFDKTKMSDAYFATYISCSWVKDVSLKFMGDKGMIIEMEESIRQSFVCCNVQWISKFPDECEVLIARTAYGYGSGKRFKLSILEHKGRIQTVGLKEDENWPDQLCFDGNGLVLMVDGDYCKISDLKIGDQVRSFPNNIGTIECVIVSDIDKQTEMVELPNNC